ncbi:MAG TPA: hypothetical protein VMP01_23540 [Pirellulaceae bacterium]|nr:hypothetical protein [Pirellulaceae bacterium]
MGKSKGDGRLARFGRNLAIVTILLGPRTRWLFVPLLTLLVLWGGLRLSWQAWGARAASGEDYVLRAEAIDLTPQPAWIHCDIKAEVVRAGGLDGLPLRDPQLVERVQQAFALHGWIARVTHVRKHYPARVEVAVEYRHPVAMVEATWRGQPSLYFIDEQSVLLPKEDAQQSPKDREEEYKNYVRIHAGDVSAAGRLAGQPWGGAKIAGAARLATLGKGRWRQLGVYRIVVSDDLNGQALYELETKNADRILWGHAPGAEISGEPEASAKWAFLLQFVARHGPLEKSAAQQRIDLRTAPAAASPATATAPSMERR